ncbi:hypothetical protein AMK33_29005 [Streptomyces sp. CB02400]|nr:hypothetical protein AMK33_29005 [Streptomyces sp. CB02400]
MTTGGGQGVLRLLDHPGSDEEGHHPAFIREGDGLAAADHPADQLLRPGAASSIVISIVRDRPTRSDGRAACSARIQLFR